jgi:RNA recognition motif-containing protein
MNLYVGNLNPETTEDSLLKIFSEFGEIVSVKIIKDPETGMSKGFGFVEMADKFHAFDAIDNIDMTYFEGQVISVREAKGKTGGNNNQRGGGNRFGGNRQGGGNRFGGNRDGGNRFGGNRDGGNRNNNGGGHRDPFNSFGPRRERDGGGGGYNRY